MSDILGKIIHPEFGDITMEVAQELAAIRAQDEAEIANEAEARQTLIASTVGQEGRVFKGGHQVAQIDARVHAYWRRREGPDFWRNELKFMLKRHPELRVISRSATPTIRVERKLESTPRLPVRGKRGRWAA